MDVGVGAREVDDLTAAPADLDECRRLGRTLDRARGGAVGPAPQDDLRLAVLVGDKAAVAADGGAVAQLTD